MRFSTATVAYLTSALVLALFPQAANAGITAFSGSTCNGAAGLNVPCDGSCHQFDDRHSFRVDGGSGNHCVTAFQDANCPAGARGRQFSFTNQNGGCQNVNTGTNIRSFICSPNNICLV
ncbi:uncharacterized protein TRAVEDRAFT_51486 [Trametes versicolor FP-101664 SS1]|uniref:uncharacterized protein n=1 Tax=Trametes versicolor (strain FP-101664) TaxID=717944 RepID=UPI0004623A20|nr:uncharacterized protein TRAVEDRAFT_51486 [Trametes versicolor FP-101664 SS1]EIW55363.1 hypothetical protein TRAVEDRAFT_51486 [Trametes versicolor FP-101664 SS1]